MCVCLPSYTAKHHEATPALARRLSAASTDSCKAADGGALLLQLHDDLLARNSRGPITITPLQQHLNWSPGLKLQALVLFLAFKDLSRCNAQKR